MDNGRSRPPVPKSKREHPPARVTMTDVAKAAGCSQATVSFVLNRVGGVKISDEMRAKVFEAARCLGYGSLPQGSRQGAPSPSLRSIGFLVDQLATSPESINAIDGARQASWDDHTVILVAQSLGNPEMERLAIEAMLQGGISGLIYMAIFTRKVVLPDHIRQLPVPVVLSNCYTDDHAYPAVVPDELAGGRRATEELIRHGHRRIATISGEPWMEAAQDRLRGYRRALNESGLAVDPALVVEGNWTPSAGYDATRKLLALKARPTAIFCQNDKMASGCFAALAEAGLRIPHDMSVIGYDDDELCRHLRPQLSSLVLPHRAMGGWAVNRLKTEPRAGSAAQAITRMECNYIGRASIERHEPA